MSVDGKWRFTVNTPAGKQYVNLDLKSQGTVLSGTVTDDHDSINTEIFDATIEGSEVNFKIKFPRPVPMTLKFSGVYEGDSMDAKVKMGIFGTRPATGVRV